MMFDVKGVSVHWIFGSYLFYKKNRIKNLTAISISEETLTMLLTQ